MLTNWIPATTMWQKKAFSIHWSRLTKRLGHSKEKWWDGISSILYVIIIHVYFFTISSLFWCPLNNHIYVNFKGDAIQHHTRFWHFHIFHNMCWGPSNRYYQETPAKNSQGTGQSSQTVNYFCMFKHPNFKRTKCFMVLSIVNLISILKTYLCRRF